MKYKDAKMPKMPKAKGAKAMPMKAMKGKTIASMTKSKQGMTPAKAKTRGKC